METVLISDLIIVFVMHYIADFWFQTKEQAENKSSSADALLTHCVIYAAPFLLFGWEFALVTFTLHLMTDYVTSRLVAKYWIKDDFRSVFKVVGLDQLIHALSLILCLHVFGGVSA